ncbi:MAG: Xanthan lyase precursor, partial [Verrucomicrobiota bacterium]
MLRLFALLLALPGLLRAEAPQPTYDIVVYGGTSAAIIAAVQAKKMGKTVIVVSPDQHLGGLSSGGLGFTDSGDKSVIGGLSRDFYHRVWQAYQKPEAWKHEAKEKFGNKGQGTVAMDASERTMWIFEPSVAEKVFEDYVKENQLIVDRNEWLDRAHGVEKQDGRIVAITTLSKRRFAGRMFIDATYEGDLMAAAGVSYTVGREANAAFDETLNGIQLAHAKSHQFTGKVDPYVIEGDPKSGLLPRIQEGPVGGKDGDGDKKIQAYNFRMCLTKVAANRVEFPKPPGYDPKQYALLARALAQGSTHVFGKFDLIPNAKTDTNNHGPFSTDNIGMNWDYPDASYERRREIIAEHRQYQQGYLYFLANDPSVPAKIREGFAQWGLAKDEFTDNGHWPHQIYVREARRMSADVVVNENHLKRKIPTPRSVGMGSYNMDSHNVQRIVVKDADG